MSDGGAQHIVLGPFFDTAGVLYPNIKVYHYAAGTINGADMWSDEAKSATVAQPFIGDTTGVARLFGDNIYKIVIHDENDNLIADYTWDNVNISRKSEGVLKSGTSFPSVVTNNTWQLAVKKDGSGNFSELGVNNGLSFLVLVKMNAAGDAHIFNDVTVNNLTVSGTTSAGAHTYIAKSADYTILTTDDIIAITTGGLALPTACTGALAGIGVGNIDDGTHSYKITFIDAEGETAGGAASNIVTVADKATDGQIALTSIPTGPGGVTSRKIYRTIAGDTGNYKYVATLADNVTTIYTDNTADSGLGADVAVVPPARVTITVPSSVIAQAGRKFIFKKADSDLGAYDIITEGAETINGLSSYKNWRQYERVVLESDGTNLFVDANNLLDEDDLASNSDVHSASQQSIKSYFDTNTISLAHTHTGGGDGAQIPQGGIAASTVGQGQLKTATGEISESVANSATEEINAVLPGGDHGFLPRAKAGTAGRLNFVGFSYDSAQTNGANLGTSYTSLTGLFTNISGSVETAYLEQVYIQASPPYKVGGMEWGHFLYLLRNITTGDIKSAYEAEDPPYAYNGPSYNPKDSIERIQAVPHPFRKYWNRDPAIDGFEIILVDLRGHNTKQWKSDNAKVGKGILEDLGSINKKGKIVTPQELGIIDIQGFTDRVKIRKP